MKKFIKKNIVLLVITAMVILGAVFYTVSVYKASNRYIEQFEQKYTDEANLMKDSISLYRVPGYHALLKQRGILSSLVKVAQSDSVNLMINLSDSTVQLLIKGVAVRNIPVCDLKISGLFRRVQEEALYKWLSEPFEIKESISTIDREPLNKVIAPNDTSDSAPEVAPNTLQKKLVFWTWNTDRDLQLYFYQVDQLSGWDAFKFASKKRWEEVREHLRAAMEFRVPDYRPVVKIGLSQEDAEVVYRALPVNGQIVITL